MPTLTTRATSVYQYFDSLGRLLYVGVTARGHDRAAEHARTKPWWDLVNYARIAHFPTREAALFEESYLIRSKQPIHNIQLRASITHDPFTIPQVRRVMGHLSRVTAVEMIDIEDLIRVSGAPATLAQLITKAWRDSLRLSETVGQFRNRLKYLATLESGAQITT